MQKYRIEESRRGILCIIFLLFNVIGAIQTNFSSLPIECGKQANLVTLKITGGKEASEGEFPWMVAIFDRKGKQFCGGSLVTTEHVLTASHCYATMPVSETAKLTVNIGDHNLKTTKDTKHEVRKVEKVLIHKKFDTKTYNNDIALLKLDNPVIFSPTVQPICLPMTAETNADRTLAGKVATVAGWGQLTSGIFGLTSNVLRKVEIPIWKYAECKRIYDRFAPGRLALTQLCAGDGKKNKDACIGDSGGPLMVMDTANSQVVQVGIVSWGKGCGSFPGVYTDTRKFMDWILKNIR